MKCPHCKQELEVELGSLPLTTPEYYIHLQAMQCMSCETFIAPHYEALDDRIQDIREVAKDIYKKVKNLA